MSYECLLYETKDRVATLTLNRPDRLNALGGTLREDLTAGLMRAIDDPDVRVIVITGAGKGFCAGGDVKAMQDANQAGRGRPLLARVVGMAKACEMIFTGQILDAEEARHLGIVSAVHPPERLLPATYELATKIALGPPIAIRLARRALYRNADADLQSSLEFETFGQNIRAG